MSHWIGPFELWNSSFIQNIHFIRNFAYEVTFYVETVFQTIFYFITKNHYEVNILNKWQILSSQWPNPVGHTLWDNKNESLLWYVIIYGSEAVQYLFSEFNSSMPKTLLKYAFRQYTTSIKWKRQNFLK